MGFHGQAKVKHQFYSEPKLSHDQRLTNISRHETVKTHKTGIACFPTQLSEASVIDLKIDSLFILAMFLLFIFCALSFLGYTRCRVRKWLPVLYVAMILEIGNLQWCFISC